MSQSNQSNQPNQFSEISEGFLLRLEILKRLLDFNHKKELLNQMIVDLADPVVWSDHVKTERLSKERVMLEHSILPLENLSLELQSIIEMGILAQELEDQATIESVHQDWLKFEEKCAQIEFKSKFSGKMDANNAFLKIQSGSGGTEAQDWAAMLLRMYLRWMEAKGFKTEILEQSLGEVAGIKSVTIKVDGDYAYGWLRTESGVHRLVRKSPFDSGNRRHTSFASVFVTPEVDDDIAIEINPADLRVDTYRASGAGGQHVNRTDSAVRITHIPTNTVVQCQSDRSQHKNRASALKQLKSELYQIEINKRNQEKQILESTKSDITWGSQIRSYVLDASRIKDLRTGVEVGNTQAVLDGDLDVFIQASLNQGL